MAIYDVNDIANKIIANTDTEHGDIISNLKLKKLLYYMQGFHLAVYGEPLFEDEVVAWQYGPVVPTMYDRFKHFGSKAIEIPDDIEIKVLSDEEEDLFDAVYREYGQFSAIKLLNMTHDEIPWKTTDLKSIMEKNKMK